MAIPLVGLAVGVVSRGRQEAEEVSCRTVAQQWVDQFRREGPEKHDPRVMAYGAYLLFFAHGL